MKNLIWTMAVSLFAALPCHAFSFIPLFQFQVFYYQDQLEIDPGANMTITGPVQANLNIYLDSPASLDFLSAVTASGGVYELPNPLDPDESTPGPVTFAVPAVSGVLPYILPGDFYFADGYASLQVPPAGELPADAYFYNEADMIIIISNNNTIRVTSGVGINNQATVISSNQWQFFLSTNEPFTDQRDNLIVNPVALNISNLVLWSATNTVLYPVLNSLTGEGNVQSIYVADFRSTSNATVSTIETSGTNYSTNTITTTFYPEAGTYVPPITSTNTTLATSIGYSLPANGTYVPPIISTNTTLVTNTSPPANGTYVGAVIHEGPHFIYDEINGYTYNEITGYTYKAITAMPYTQTTYHTNWTIVSQPGIVLSNGAVLPPQGLSIATPDPAYIVGNWNIKTSFSASAPSDAGLTDTSYTLPSAIYADAINVLSPAWNPANSAASLSSRVATADTVNAAFFTGDVPSNGENYSGGLENFPRFAENWSGNTFTWNGSMCCMFLSQIATGPWPGTGTVYNPPIRNWAFDINFYNDAMLPPLTPAVEQTAMLPASVLQAVPDTSGKIILSWITRPGASYTVQYKTNLSQENWACLATFIASSNSSSFSDSSTDPQRFYRLQISP